jgi:hypothetical protein
VPKTGEAMRAAGFTEADIEKELFDNPIAFFAQSGRITRQQVCSAVKVDQTMLFQENSALRGQEPVIQA